MTCASAPDPEDRLPPIPRAAAVAAAGMIWMATGAPAAPVPWGAGVDGTGPAEREGPVYVESGAGRGKYDGALALEAAVAYALEKNLALHLARSEIVTAEQGVEVERAEFDPASVFDASHNDRRQPSAASDLEGADQPESLDSQVGASVEKTTALGTTVSLSADLFDRNETNSSFARINPEYNSSVSLTLQQPLLKNGGRTVTLAPLRQAGLQLARSRLELQDEINQVLLDTEQAYWLLVAQAAAEEIRRQALDLAGVIVEEATERREANLATRVDLLEARSAAAQRREALLVAIAATMDAKDQLFRAMGVLATTEPGALDLEALRVDRVGGADARKSFEAAMQFAPDSLLYQNAIRSREVDLAVARRNRLPGFDVGFSTGVLGRAASQTDAFRRTADRDGVFWEATVELRLPWGFRLERAQLLQAREALGRALIDRQNAEAQLYADIRSAVREVNLARERIAAATVTAELSSLQFEQTVEERNAGEATMRDLLEAQDTMEEAKVRVIEAQVDLLRADAALSQLEGTLPQRHGIAPVVAGRIWSGGQGAEVPVIRPPGRPAK